MGRSSFAILLIKLISFGIVAPLGISLNIPFLGEEQKKCILDVDSLVLSHNTKVNHFLEIVTEHCVQNVAKPPLLDTLLHF